MAVLVSHSCQTEGIDEPVVARVGESFLTLEDLKNSIPDDLSPEDSSELADNVIQNWMNRELLFRQAKFNLDVNQVEIEKQVAKYRKELFIYEYEKKLVQQKLDTNISDEEVRKFYSENSDIFLLNDYILKVRYSKLKPNSPELEKVGEWMKGEDSTSLESLKDYCHKYAVNCYYDTSWVYFNELLRQLPIEVYNKESFIRSGKLVRFTDSEHLYLLYIIKFQNKNTLSPFELEVDRIKNLILNKRKIELLNTIRRSLYKDAIREGKAEKYEEPELPK